MSLDGRSIKVLAESAMNLAEIIKYLENSYTDPRTLDLIEIAISLIEDQLNSDIKYMAIKDYSEEEPKQDDLDEFLKTHLANAESEPAKPEPQDNVTPDELRGWFDLPSYGEDNEFK